jgi:hypothetical protein
MYAKTYPSLPRVADSAAQERLLHATAPPVVSGMPLDEVSLLSTTTERQLREVAAQRGALTHRDVLAAVVREHAILSEHAAATFPTPFAAAVTPGVNLQDLSGGVLPHQSGPER